MILTNDVQLIIKQLEQHGYQAFAVGGCVRDSMLGIEPHDWDICTKALPEQIKQCFSSYPYRTFETGIQHGTITVILNQTNYEITTYRIDGEYLDNRRPNDVRFVSSIEQDLQRRDFTINAMAYNDSSGLIDLFGGKLDLEKGLIKCVGDSRVRFEEDALRIMRALRFASTYSFSVDEETSKAIHHQCNLLENIAIERISSELVRLLLGDGVKAILTVYSDVICVVIPEILPTVGLCQNNPYHCYDVWEHTSVAVQNASKNQFVRLAMLFHDIGKPECYTMDEDGIGHFYSHAEISAVKAEMIMKRLKLDRRTVEIVTKLVRLHGAEMPTSEKGIKRWLNKHGCDFVKLLIQVKLADVSAQTPRVFEERKILLMQLDKIIDDIVLKGECFTIKNLAVNGNDLIKLGISQGKQVGSILDQLLDLVIDGGLDNKYDDLMAHVKIILTSSKSK